jgi:hypothetical protein
MAEKPDMLRAAYDVLLDHDAAPSGRRIDVDSARPPSFTELAATVADELRGVPDGRGVEIRVDGRSLGVSSRRKLSILAGSAGGEPDTSLGSGDRASLEGESTQYRALRYACMVTGCRREGFRSFHDSRYVPSCTDHHVPMEPQGWI